jgi:undecaprenyl-diphosphatase
MDLFLFNKLNSFSLKYFYFDVLVIFLADYLGYILVSILILFLILDFRKFREMVIKAFISALISRFLIVEIIRFFWYRPRPFLIENNVNLLIFHNAASFPSGHAAFFFALSFIIYFYNKKIGLFFLLSTFLISLARVAAGIHWPSDIFFGALIGFFISLFFNKFLFSRNFIEKIK